jgi:hypothetical protein
MKRIAILHEAEISLLDNVENSIQFASHSETEPIVGN